MPSSPLTTRLFLTAALYCVGLGPIASAAQLNLETATIPELNAAFKSGALTSESLTERYLARLKAYDQDGPKLNAVITLNPKALEEAKALDAERIRAHPESFVAQERMRFSFPRQRKEPWQSIADFFRPVATGEADYAAFHVVTMSDVASAHSAKLFAANQYQDYLYFHGLSVEMAEALAEYWHHRIRDEWGFADEDGPSLGGLFKQQYRGSRYSWGYPACPDLDDQVKVAELLEIGRIGVTVSEEFQLHPEQSTSAIIVHHPEAKYFILG